MIGEDKLTTILTFDDYGSKPGVGGTDNSYSTLIEANDFYAENITFENTIDSRIAAYTTGGQAVALMLKGDRTTIHNCIIRGFQDTFYTKGIGRTYVHCSQIEGTTDFIFGAGIAVFDNCTIVSKKNSYITAAANISADNKYNYVFIKCKLTAIDGATNVFLGRPWKLYAKVVYMQCEEGPHIDAAGWSDWSSASYASTAYFAEYKCTGPGFKPSSRISWSHQLSDAEASAYTIPQILAANAATPAYTSSWIPLWSDIDCNAVITNNQEPLNYAAHSNIWYTGSTNKMAHFYCNLPNQVAEFKIYGFTGLPLYSCKINWPSHSGEISIPTNTFPDGVYFYNLIMEQKSETGKFILLND